jgi:hypothetical protein
VPCISLAFSTSAQCRRTKPPVPVANRAPERRRDMETEPAVDRSPLSPAICYRRGMSTWNVVLIEFMFCLELSHTLPTSLFRFASYSSFMIHSNSTHTDLIFVFISYLCHGGIYIFALASRPLRDRWPTVVVRRASRCHHDCRPSRLLPHWQHCWWEAPYAPFDSVILYRTDPCKPSSKYISPAMCLLATRACTFTFISNSCMCYLTLMLPTAVRPPVVAC